VEHGDDLLIPPLNFGRVSRGVYRSGFPGKKNFNFLKVGILRFFFLTVPRSSSTSEVLVLQIG
jgi:hypothetical protein